MLYRFLIQKRKAEYTTAFFKKLCHLFNEKDSAKQTEFMLNFALAILSHVESDIHKTEDVHFMLTVQTPHNFIDSIHNMLLHGVLDLFCLDICLQHVLRRSIPATKLSK